MVKNRFQAELPRGYTRSPQPPQAHRIIGHSYTSPFPVLQSPTCLHWVLNVPVHDHEHVAKLIDPGRAEHPKKPAMEATSSRWLSHLIDSWFVDEQHSHPIHGFRNTRHDTIKDHTPHQPTNQPTNKQIT